jgi:hypothetical protein
MSIASNVFQKRKFKRLSSQLPTVYKKVKGGNIKEFLMSFWDQQNTELENVFLPNLPYDFFDNSIIRDTMFVSPSQGWVNLELEFLKKHYKSRLPLLAQEDKLGNPEILPEAYNSSSNLIHHLYHFAKFEKATGQKMAEVTSVVEWGGGYGNMAKLYKRLNPQGTYTIIDTGLFCAIQWLYLSTLMPKDSVNIIAKNTDKISSGKINIIPLRYLKNHIPSGELFISTWGLSESTKYAQDFVVKNEWFSARKILVGFQKSTNDLSHASRLGKLAKEEGARIEETEFIKNNYYAFK